MQFRGMLAGLVLLVVLGVGVWWSNKQKPDEDKKGTADAPKILAIPEADITQIEIRKKGQPPTILKKTDKWQIVAPQALAADGDSVNPMVSGLASLNSDRLVDEKPTDLAQFGLAPPDVEVVVTKKDGKNSKLLFGDQTPTGSGFFTRLDGDPRVFSVASFSKNAFDKTPNDLRDKRLLIFENDKLTRLELTAKNQTMEFGRNSQGEWQILKPKPLRADNYQVEEILRKLKDAKMDTATVPAEAEKAPGLFKNGKPVAIAKTSDSSGTKELEVRKSGEAFYAKSSALEGIYKLTAEVGNGLDKGLDELRNKKLFDFGFNEVSKVELNNNGKAATYEKKGEKWMAGSQEMDSVSVQSLIDKLRDLASITFPEKGFTTPVFQVTVTSKEGKLVDKVAISKAGTTYIAQRENEPALYELDSRAVEELQKTASDVKPAAPKDDKQKKKK
jgi:Domain of unknown function (DUF4340)